MEFDVQGIYTVANKVLPDGATKLDNAQKRIANAHVAGDPFAESIPQGLRGELMFAKTDKAWNDACGQLQEAMKDTVEGIGHTCSGLIATAKTYDQTELMNTESMHDISRLLGE